MQTAEARVHKSTIVHLESQMRSAPAESSRESAICPAALSARAGAGGVHGPEHPSSLDMAGRGISATLCHAEAYPSHISAEDETGPQWRARHLGAIACAKWRRKWRAPFRCSFRVHWMDPPCPAPPSGRLRLAFAAQFVHESPDLPAIQTRDPPDLRVAEAKGSPFSTLL